MAQGRRPDPFRTRKLRPGTAMVLHPTGCGRVARRRTTRHTAPTGTTPAGAVPVYPDTNTHTQPHAHRDDRIARCSTCTARIISKPHATPIECTPQGVTARHAYPAARPGTHRQNMTPPAHREWNHRAPVRPGTVDSSRVHSMPYKPCKCIFQACIPSLCQPDTPFRYRAAKPGIRDTVSWISMDRRYRLQSSRIIVIIPLATVGVGVSRIYNET